MNYENIFRLFSSLFKLYHREEDTVLIEQIFSKVTVTSIYLSEITKVEFTSSVWKKVRTKEITELDAIKSLQLFERDSAKYTFIATDSLIIEQARILTTKYGFKGLRTLDSIQLSSAISFKSEVGLFVTSDNLLKSLLSDEGLQTDMPSS